MDFWGFRDTKYGEGSHLTNFTGSSPPETDRALIARVEGRDADALAALYDRHSSRLLGLAYRILGGSGEAEEVLQEVFLYAWKSASSFDPSRGTVLAWLLVATRSRSIDRLRSRRPSFLATRDEVEELASRGSGEDLESDSATRQWSSRCKAAIAELPADQRQALELAYFEGLTQQEIAQRTQTPLGTVKTRVRLGLMKLRERINPYVKSESRDA